MRNVESFQLRKLVEGLQCAELCVACAHPRDVAAVGFHGVEPLRRIKAAVNQVWLYETKDGAYGLFDMSNTTPSSLLSDILLQISLRVQTLPGYPIFGV